MLAALRPKVPDLTEACETRTESMVHAALNPALAIIDEGLRSLTGRYLTIIEEAGEASATAATSRQDIRVARWVLHFDKANPHAAAYAELYAAELVTGVSAGTKAAVRAAITEAFMLGLPPGDVARLIESQVGLTIGQAEAVRNLRKRMLDSPGKVIKAGKTRIRIPKSGATNDLIARRQKQYADRLLRQRAVNIARTETVKAANEGQRQLWLQSQQRGLLPKDALREWLTTPNPCPICEPLAGETALIDQAYPSGYLQPPAHPGCKCSQMISRNRLVADRPSTPFKTSDFNPKSYRQIGALAEDVKSRLGLTDVSFNFSSAAADSNGAFAYFDPRVRSVNLGSRVSEGLAELMTTGNKNAETYNALRSLCHELSHAGSPVMRAMGAGETLPEWAMLWEEGIVEFRARTLATELMFGEGKIPQWVASASSSYVEEVRSVQWLVNRGMDPEAFFNWSGADRLQAIKYYANAAGEEMLTYIANGAKLSPSEWGALVEQLGDDVQHFIRLHKLTPGQYGAMTRRQILNELKKDWEINTKTLKMGPRNYEKFTLPEAQTTGIPSVGGLSEYEAAILGSEEEMITSWTTYDLKVWSKLRNPSHELGRAFGGILDDMPVFKGTSYRGMTLTKDQAKTLLSDKNTFILDLHSSSSIDVKEAKKFLKAAQSTYEGDPFLLEIRGKSGRNLAEYMGMSDDSTEAEIILSAGTKYRIKSVKKTKDYTHIVLEEV